MATPLCRQTRAAKKAFTEDAMIPGQAAKAASVTYATAKRWYDRWADEIKRSLESRPLPGR